MRAGLFLFLLSWVGFGAPVSADVRAGVYDYGACFRALFTQKRPRQKSALEVELALTDRILRLVETTDGTVAPVLRGLPVPAFLGDRARHLGVAVGEVPWKKLSVAERRELLQVAAIRQYDETDYKEDWVRLMRGLKMPEKLLKRWRATKSRRGPLSEAEWGIVEHLSHSGMKKLEGTELHILAKKPAGQLVKHTWKFFEGSPLAGYKPAFHEHIVDELDRVLPLNSGEIRITQLADFKRRAEVTALLFGVLENMPLTTKKKFGLFLFGPMEGPKFRHMFDWLKALAKRDAWALTYSDEFKAGMVGLRGPRTYKSDQALLGFEYRAILMPNTEEWDYGRSPQYEQNMVQLLDGLQGALFEDNFGLSPTQILDWKADSLGKGSIPKRLQDNYFLKPVDILAKSAPAEVRALMDASEGSWIHLGTLISRDPAFSMLLHDWSDDPLFFNQPALQTRIREAQARALRTVLKTRNEDRNTDILKIFLMESGLFESFLSSVGTRIVPKP